MAVLAGLERSRDLRAAVRLEAFTVGWMALEALVGIGAGLAAGSVLLTAFGLDSVVELLSGSVLLRRLLLEAAGRPTDRVERAERRAAWVVGLALALLCLYVLATALAALATRARPDAAPAGLALAVAALLLMPPLAQAKRRLADRLDSAALRGDAACSITCAWLAGALLVGLAVNGAFRLWWADAVAALALLYWLLPEARAALSAARAGRGGCCADDGRP